MGPSTKQTCLLTALDLGLRTIDFGAALALLDGRASAFFADLFGIGRLIPRFEDARDVDLEVDSGFETGLDLRKIAAGATALGDFGIATSREDDDVDFVFREVICRLTILTWTFEMVFEIAMRPAISVTTTGFGLATGSREAGGFVEAGTSAIAGPGSSQSP
jgi:hypothetical protein